MNAKPKFLVRFKGSEGDEFGVRTATEAFKLIEAKYPECWPGLDSYRMYRHRAWAISKIWESYYAGQAALTPVAEIWKLGGVNVCYGKQNPEYPPGASCDKCLLRIACQHALESHRGERT